MNDNNYQPVSCKLHSELELAIMRGLKLEICWIENGEPRTDVVQPLDMITRNKQEFLAVLPGDEKRGDDKTEIRLDNITSFNVV